MKTIIYITSGSGEPDVSKLCFSLDCGSNGFTAMRKDLADQIADGKHPDLMRAKH